MSCGLVEQLDALAPKPRNKPVYKDGILTVNVEFKLKVPVKRDSAGRRINPMNLVSEEINRLTWAMLYLEIDTKCDNENPFQLSSQEQDIMFSLLAETEPDEWKQSWDERHQSLIEEYKVEIERRRLERENAKIKNPWLKKASKV